MTRLSSALIGLAGAGFLTLAGPAIEWTRLQPFPTTAQAKTLICDGQAVVAAGPGLLALGESGAIVL